MTKEELVAMMTPEEAQKYLSLENLASHPAWSDIDEQVQLRMQVITAELLNTSPLNQERIIEVQKEFHALRIGPSLPRIRMNQIAGEALARKEAQAREEILNEELETEELEAAPSSSRPRRRIAAAADNV